MMNPVEVKLKNIDRGEVWFLKQAVNIQVIVEGGQLGVDGDGMDVGDDATSHGCLCSADITEKITFVGRWNMVQEPGDCGEYLEQKSLSKGLVDNYMRQEASLTMVLSGLGW